MMSRVSIVLIVFLIACSTRERVPAGVLDKETMVKVLTEMYIGEEKVNRLGLVRDSSEKVFKIIDEKIQQKTGVPDSVFRRSLDYYYNHPQDMELIYTALVDTLNLQEQRESVKHPPK